jgi:hypothetical protein
MVSFSVAFYGLVGRIRLVGDGTRNLTHLDGPQSKSIN